MYSQPMLARLQFLLTLTGQSVVLRENVFFVYTRLAVIGSSCI